jgi:hypothetical protein
MTHQTSSPQTVLDSLGITLIDMDAEPTQAAPTSPRHRPVAPAVVFEPDRLTISANGVELDLTSLQSLDEQGRVSLPGVWPDQFGHLWPAVVDEIEQAAWTIFHNHRFNRALATGDPAPSFDFWGLLKAGYRFDWDLGTVTPPGRGYHLAKHVTPLSDIHVEEDGDDELLADNYLRRGGAILLAGPTGIGKSSLAMQLAVGFALNLDTLGFRPVRPLATLIVQAENDASDLCQMRNGIFGGFDLTEDQEAFVNDFVATVTIDDCMGAKFGPRLNRAIRDWHPDLVILDPLLAFVGGDIAKQEVASTFLRGVLNPILHRANVGLLALHHTGKPPRDPKEGAAPLADYIGLGSSELSNWPRGILALHRTDNPSVFRLEAGKRGGRLEWMDANQVRTSNRFISHAQHGIFWEECTPEQEQRVVKREKEPSDLMPHVPLTGSIPQTVLFEKASAAGVGTKKSRAFLDELVHAGKLHIWRVPRPGTRPSICISRAPQPDPSLLTP